MEIPADQRSPLCDPLQQLAELTANLERTILQQIAEDLAALHLGQALEDRLEETMMHLAQRDLRAEDQGLELRHVGGYQIEKNTAHDSEELPNTIHMGDLTSAMAG